MGDVMYTSNMVMMSSWWVSLPEKTVKNVIDAYNDFVTKKIRSGITVDYLSLGTLVGVKNTEFLPLGYQFYEVAEKLGLDYNVVENILTRYEELIKNQLLLKNIVVVYGIIKFMPSSGCKVNVKTSSRFSAVGVKVRARVNPYLVYEVSTLV